MEKMATKNSSNFESIILSFVKYSLMNIFWIYIEYLENDLKINDYPLLFNPVHKNLAALFWLCDPTVYGQLTLLKISEQIIFDNFLQKEIENENRYKQLKKDKYFLLNEQLNFIYDLIENKKIQDKIMYELLIIFFKKRRKEKTDLKIFKKYYHQQIKNYVAIKRKINIQPPLESQFYRFFITTR